MADVRTENELRSFDPATGELLGSVKLTTPDALDAAVSRARAAFESEWSRNAVLRADALNRWADGLAAGAEDLSTLLLRETGKIRAETEREVAMSVDALRFNAGIARQLDGDAGPLPDGSIAYVERQPIGVSGMIVPWNWPVFLLMRDLAPALAAGVTAVIKPAPQTPLSTRHAVEVARRAGVPDGVLEVVYGGADVGSGLVTHRDVRAIAFTGSTEVGKEVMRTAAADLTRVLLELGGKGVSLVFADADVDAAVAACVQNAFVTSGQMCMANTRTVVERPAFDAVRDAVVERVRGLRVGHPDAGDTDIGPLISRQHCDRVMGYVDLARRRGSILAGGERTGNGGAFLAPTVIGGGDLDEPLVTEEIFGPVVSVEPFGDEESAIAMANASPYGLVSAVWTADVNRAWRVARRIDAGTVWVNRYNRMFPEVPSGGFKQSGIGRTRGLEGLRQFSEIKHINWAIEPSTR
jgi:betaine-aldehyde dehydrogenase